MAVKQLKIGLCNRELWIARNVTREVANGIVAFLLFSEPRVEGALACHWDERSNVRVNRTRYGKGRSAKLTRDQLVRDPCCERRCDP